MEGYLGNNEILKKEILKLTDWYTDDIFYSEEDLMVIANFSRVFCDVERFTDDAIETMAKFGMGVLYEKSDDGENLRIITPEYKEMVLNAFYHPHHNQLNTSINNQLNHFGKALILDCHSFSNTPFIRDLDRNPNRPDFNIGTDDFHTPKNLTDLSVAFFEDKGFTVGLDWPYSGSIVPLEHYKKNINVQSIMLEINRSLYLEEPTNEKSENYPEIKKLVSEFIKTIKTTL